VSCCPASLIPPLKFSPGSPSSGKLLVLVCRAVLEGVWDALLCATRLLEGKWLGSHCHLRKDRVKTENIFTEGLEKTATHWFALLA